MKEIFEFIKTDINDYSFINLKADEEMISEYLFEASTERDESELGNIEHNPEALTTAVELPHHSQLNPEYKGMYVRYSSSCANQHWGTKATVTMAINLAYNWWKKGYTPTMLLGDLSARIFSQTGCHSAHKNGTHLDADLAGTLPRDSGYNFDRKKKCAIAQWFAIQLGVRRSLFSDSDVAKAVNKAAQDNNLRGRVVVRADHDNHFHFEM